MRDPSHTCGNQRAFFHFSVPDELDTVRLQVGQLSVPAEQQAAEVSSDGHKYLGIARSDRKR